MLSFWERDQLTHFDYAIVGGGILGLYTAYEFSRKYPRAKIAIFDKAMYSLGATTRNAGFACFGSLTEIASDRQKWGDAKTLEIIQKRWQGIQKIQTTLGKEIDYEALGGYELIFQPVDLTSCIEDMNRFLYPIFQKNVFSSPENKQKEFGFSAEVTQLIYNPLEGQIHSGKLVLALHKRLQRQGVCFFSHSEITDYQDGNTVKFCINQQQQVSTVKLIFCTNALAPQPASKITPARGQVLLTEPMDNLKFKGCFHFDEGYYYFRNVGQRILFGGGRNLDIDGETSTRLELNEKIQLDLESKLSQIISPEICPKIDLRWSGIMAFSESKLPVLDAIGHNVYYAMNCNGMGISLSPVTALELCEFVNK